MAVDAARAKSLFLAAADLPDSAERGAYLDRECGGNMELRARVEALLRANDASPMPEPEGTTPYHKDAPALPAVTESYAGSGEQAGAVIAGKYTLVEVIGEGGMGSVWRAKQSEPVKRFVAVKLIKAGMDSKQVLARFEAERQALALMDHTSIAKVLDGGLHERRPFFVMELVKGVPITKYCDDSKLTPRERLELFVPVCQAIQHAHQKGIIHRDIKPSNVLVALYDEKPVVKVIDFGVAKATGGTLTEQTIDTGFGAVVGTPEYMSPEQATFNNLDIDTRSDVYALGALLYELLTGSPPFSRKELEKKGLVEILRVVREEEPPRPSTRLSTADTLPSISARRGTEPKKLTGLLRNELDWIVMKALEKDRMRRYQTANGFAADVQRYLVGETVQAHPPSRSYRLKKFVRRNKVQVIAGSLVLVAMVTGIAGTSWGLVEAKRSADEERLAKEDAETKRREMDRQRIRAEAGEKLAGERLVQVEAEKDNAENEKRIAQAVRDFLQNKLLGQADVTAQANSIVALGGASELVKLNPTIRELLDRAAEELSEGKIEANFPNQPKLQAEVLRTVGETYLGVGEFEQAVRLLEHSRRLCSQSLGTEHPDTLRSMNLLASAYNASGKLGQALPLYQETLKIFRAKLGVEHPDTLVTMNNLAAAYQNAWKLDLAIPLFEETQERIKSKLGTDHPNTLSITNNLAMAYRDAGQQEQALKLLEGTLKFRKEKHGSEHPDTLVSMNNLASVYQDRGKMDLAVPLLEETVKLSKAKLGANHPRTLDTMNNLALTYQGIGKFDLALPLFEETLKLKKVKLGADHANTLTTMLNLARAYRDAGKLDLALLHFEETLLLTKAKLGTNHPQTLAATAGLALGYRDVGKFDLAMPLFEETLKLVQTNLGADHPGSLTIMNNIASAYQAAGKLDMALPLLEETLKFRKAKQGAEHPDTLVSMNNIGSAYQAAGKLDQAMPLLLETQNLMKAKLGTDHPNTLTNMNNLALAYQAAGKQDLALPLFEENLKLRKAKLGADHPDTLVSMNNLATGYLASGKSDLALSLMEETCRLMKAKLGADHPNTLTSMNNLASAYKASKKLDLALPLWEETLRLIKTKMGNDHPDTLACMNNLAAGYWSVNRLDQSIPLFEATLVLREKKMGRKHPDTLRTMANLGVNYKDAGRVAEAIPLLEEALRASTQHPTLSVFRAPLIDVYIQTGKREAAAQLLAEVLAEARKQFPKESPQLTNRLTVIGVSMLKAKLFVEAESLLRECLAVRVDTEPNRWRTFDTHSLIGEALLGQEKYAEAEPLLLKGYEGMKQQEGTLPPDGKRRLSEALDRLIQFYTKTKKPDKLKVWQAEKDALDAKRTGKTAEPAKK